MSDVAELMKRCQRGVGGRNALDEAHDIMAECYGTLGRLESERDALAAENARLRNSMLRLVTTHCAAAIKGQAADAELEQYLAAGIAQLEGQRDKLAGELAAIRERHAIARRVVDRIGQLCTTPHESKERFIRRVQSVIEWEAQALSAEASP